METMRANGQLNVYRSCVPVVDMWYEKAVDEHITEVLVEAVAEAEGVDATDIGPLYEVVDLEAVSKLFTMYDGTSTPEAVFSFTYENWNVFVRADGRIRVCDGTRSTAPEPVFEGSTV